MSAAMGITGITISLTYGWALALVIIGISPLLLVAGSILGFAITTGAESSKKAYERCGGYAEEALSAIRTVYSFCAENLEKNKYFSELAIAQAAGIKSAGFRGFAIGLINFAVDFLLVLVF